MDRLRGFGAYMHYIFAKILYHVGEARVKKVGAWKGKIGVIFRQKNLKSGGATTTTYPRYLSSSIFRHATS